MHKLYQACRSMPQLTIVVLLLPFIIGLWNISVPQSINILRVLPLSTWNPTIGQWLIVLLVAYTCVDAVIGIIDDIRHRKLGIDLLAVVALATTLAVQEYWAGWVVVLMVWSGAAIEDIAHNKAQQNLALLVNAAPQTAHRMMLPGVNNSNIPIGKLPCEDEQACQKEACSLCSSTNFRKVTGIVQKTRDKQEASSSPSSARICPLLQTRLESGIQRYDTVPVCDVHVGDVIIVLPGETVPVDGVLLSGSAILDMSAINGEPMPRELFAGAKVLSGCVNGGVVLIMRVTRTSENSQYQKIMGLVESARSSRAAVVRFADMLAVPFTIISLLIAGAAWWFSQDVMRFAQVLVLATPCPLLIAVPVALMAGTGRLAKSGIIVKSQDVLEQLSRVTDIFFDKTGTLTVKQPQVRRVELMAEYDQKVGRETIRQQQEERILLLAGVLETYSHHILAGGIVQAGSKLWQSRYTSTKSPMPTIREYPVVRDVKETAGQGICGMVDGVQVRVGRRQYVLKETQIRSYDQPESTLASDEMATYVAFDGELVGRIVLKDVPRDNAAQTIAGLRKLGMRSLAMLTGDSHAAAQTIGKEVGIQTIYADLLPEDKLRYLREHHEHHKQSENNIVTMMVGDGINDAPVLAAANIGVALTDGTDTAASECAQVVIMNNNIGGVLQAITIARRTKQIMVQSVLLGLGMAIIGMIVAAFGIIPAVVGAFMQEIIDVVAIVWSLTALRSS